MSLKKMQEVKFISTLKQDLAWSYIATNRMVQIWEGGREDGCLDVKYIIGIKIGQMAL